MKRKKVNSEILKDINEYWTAEKKAELLKKMRKGIFLVIGPFEEIEEPKIQNWAHRMVPKESLQTHADRLDIKASLRKYMRKQTVAHLGLQKYFPELFIEEVKPEEKKNES